jgi:hypothetical protein
LERRKRKVKKMRIEVSLDMLSEIAIDAITEYSELFYTSKWYSDVEYEVYDIVKNNQKGYEFFRREYQWKALRTLLLIGYWVYWTSDGPRLSRINKHFNINHEDNLPIKNGAD